MSTTVASPKSKKQKKPRLNWYPFWAPRFWHGMGFGDLMRLLARHRFRIHPARVPMAVIVTHISLINSFMQQLQKWTYGRAIAETEIDQPPVFVIGHWRSGTTLLHELLVLDDRFAYPTTYQCFAPSHFLISERIFPHLLWILLPAKRPMDNMSVSFDHPQEDEFAMIALGAPTPMRRLAFPNDPPEYMEFLDMEGVDERDLTQWKAALLGFVRALTYHHHKPLVLKSPPHTGRLAVLAELFPGAKFVHIVRDPFALFPSNRRLWMSLDEVQGFQLPRHEHLDDFVFTAFERMYRGFDRQRPAIDPSNICDVRYEDLVQDPVGQLRAVYEKLHLGDFESVREKVDQYVRDRSDYQANRHELEPELREQIRTRWAGYIEKYGYADC